MSRRVGQNWSLGQGVDTRHVLPHISVVVVLRLVLLSASTYPTYFLLVVDLGATLLGTLGPGVYYVALAI